MSRTLKMYEREEEFQSYVKMAETNQAAATAMVLREQDEARVREDARRKEEGEYRKMDGKRHGRLVRSIRAVDKKVEEHAKVPISKTHLKYQKNGNGKKEGATVFGYPLRDVIVLVGIMAAVMGVGSLSFIGG